MTSKRQTAKEKLQRARDTLATSPDTNGLTVALLAINGALDDWLGLGIPRARPRSQKYDIRNYRDMPEYKAARQQGAAPRLGDKLYELRNNRIITRAESDFIATMRGKRNTGAHGGELELTFADVDHYCELVGKIMGEPRRPRSPAQSRARPVPKTPNTNSEQGQFNPQELASRNPVSSSPQHDSEGAGRLPSIQNSPSQPSQPTLQPKQAARAPSDKEFLSQLLNIDADSS